MEPRHRNLRSSSVVSQNLSIDTDNPEGLTQYFTPPSPIKERKSYSRSTWLGLGISCLILFIIAFILSSHRDIVHHALSHSTSYTINLVDFGSNVLTHLRPSNIPIQSLLDMEYAIKTERQAKLKGKDDLAGKSKSNASVSNKLSSNDSGISITNSISSSNEKKITAHLRSEEEKPQQPLTVPVPPQLASDIDLEQQLHNQEEKVRHMKNQLHVVMETDPDAKAEISLLQSLSRKYVLDKYGAEPYNVEMRVHFPQSMQQAEPNLSTDGRILINLAPLQYLPYTVYYFLQVVDSFKVSLIMSRACQAVHQMDGAIF
jgi:hypothetical protein